MKFYTVYKTVNKENGKYYIGKHITNDPYDGYLGSGKILKRAIKKYSIESFQKFVLYIFDNNEEMVKKEIELVNEEMVKDPISYNLKKGGHGGQIHLKGYHGTEKHIKNCQLGGKIYADKVRNIPIYRQNATEKLMKWSKSNDPKIKKQRSEHASRIFKGKHHTEEAKRKIGEKNSIHQKGENNSNYGNCWIYSISEKKSICIPKNNLQMWLDKGWIKGRKQNF